MDIADYRALLARIFAGRRFILALDVLAGATPVVAELKKLGAERALCIATSPGTGPLPDPEFAPDPIVVPVEAPDIMRSIRRSLDQLADLPAGALDRIDAFDPDRRARVLGTIFDDGRAVGGRTKYGARPAAWQALEDKTTIDAFWAEADIAHAPSRVVPATLDALEGARGELDRGDGVAFSGDNRSGFNGGATYVRWIRSAADVREVTPFFSADCDVVRVMPFLEGIPCSIHGCVFPDHTLVLRPCEMLVFRQPGRTTLHYGRAASFWDPPDADRITMRDVARRTGESLRKRFGYRGAFTVDGVLSREGFLPTELNPRFGAALGVLTSKIDLPLLLLNAAVVEGEDADWNAGELERILLEAADRHRAGGGSALTGARQTETRSVNLTWSENGFRIALENESADATAMLGPSPMGGWARIELVAERTPVGPSVAPRVANALACIDAHWKLGIGALEPAVDVRA
jgi:hypothetical protein